MTIKHLKSNFIDSISLGLDEDVYGANGDLNDFDTEVRVIENIHHHTGFQYHDSGMLPVRVVARLIRSVWEDKDRDYMEVIVGGEPGPLPAVDRGTVLQFKKPNSD